LSSADRHLRAFAVEEPRQGRAVLHRRFHGETDPGFLTRRVEGGKVVACEGELDAAGLVAVGLRVQRQFGLAGRELGPERRLEGEGEAELVAMEGDIIFSVDERSACTD